jgi:iron-sulfur cluster repair protein YtfE (RIC family)
MYVQIGSPKEPSDVVDLLLECHERIRTFIGLACKLGEAQEPSVDEIRDAASRVSRYFSEALPLHVADEEESILPRLKGRSPELDLALEKMRNEHIEHHGRLQLLLNTCNTLKSSPEMFVSLRDTLSFAASSLEKEYAEHLDEEERVVLPAIRTLLPPDQRTAIESELRSRRR